MYRARIRCSKSNNVDPVGDALADHFIGPDARLYFANVRFAQEIHAEARLADTAANRQRKLAI